MARRFRFGTVVLAVAAMGMASWARADGSISQVATLSSSASQPYFLMVASSGATVVAAGDATDVFTEPADGWASESQSAVLSDPAAAFLPSGLSILGDTVVEGLQATNGPGFEDVFVEPEGGWSRTVLPAARLVASDGVTLIGGVISGRTVVAIGVDPRRHHHGALCIYRAEQRLVGHDRAECQAARPGQRSAARTAGDIRQHDLRRSAKPPGGRVRRTDRRLVWHARTFRPAYRFP